MFFWILMADMAVLFWCGGLPAAEPYVMISQIATAYYFMHFLVIVPLVSRSEKTAPLPNSITDAVLGTGNCGQKKDKPMIRIISIFIGQIGRASCRERGCQYV